jgi:hypothetical protein
MKAQDIINEAKEHNFSDGYECIDNLINLTERQSDKIEELLNDIQIHISVALTQTAKRKVTEGESNKKDRELIAANKIILSLEDKVKELEAVNERLKGEL